MLPKLTLEHLWYGYTRSTYSGDGVLELKSTLHLRGGLRTLNLSLHCTYEDISVNSSDYLESHSLGSLLYINGSTSSVNSVHLNKFACCK